MYVHLFIYFRSCHPQHRCLLFIMIFALFLQLTDVPEAKRRYKLRPTLSAGRATFVCYTCGTETASSNLVLVYCCQNSENEPFFPFIKSIKPYPNASPISPQGKQTDTHIKEKQLYILKFNFREIIYRNGANML